MVKLSIDTDCSEVRVVEVRFRELWLSEERLLEERTASVYT